MAIGKISNFANQYKEYTLTKNSTATNWTLIRSHACIQNGIAYIQIVASVTTDQDTSSVTLINLPNDLKPKYDYETRVSSSQQEIDVNIGISANSTAFIVARQPASKSGNFRADISYPVV